ncbi:ABC transporter permease [Solirhodobacter olei]|uniref:ABC transporter permease n=1 Tax=Solirhodobacter olei TaxID=2493082 RepID=UPI000FDC43C2|nr:ABC transporter permease subunit [Solirhodobacter olei]
MASLSSSVMTQARPQRREAWLKWVGIIPFAIFSVMFLILPTLYIVFGAFQTQAGAFTLQNIRDLNTDLIRAAYAISIKISLASALIGCVVGFAISAAVVFGGLPKWVRGPIMTFSGVASNFAGVPLAFAFIATLGPVGIVTVLLRDYGINLRVLGFNLLTYYGLVIVYLFFEIPLMILIITPALDGMKKEWREAASMLGANTRQYWQYVALPILFPSLLGTFALLFANAFGAVATAYALAGPAFTLVPITLFSQIRGDVLGNPQLGFALAFGMIVITGIANVIYIVLRTRAERWMQ